jgi:hypothetical protein
LDDACAHSTHAHSAAADVVKTRRQRRGRRTRII